MKHILGEVEFHLPEVCRFRHSFHIKSGFYSIESWRKRRKKKKREEEGKERNEAELSLKSDSNVKDNVFHSWNTHNYIRNIIIIDCAIRSSSSRMPVHAWLESFIFEFRCVLIRKMYNDVVLKISFLLSRTRGFQFYVIFCLLECKIDL